jgi:tRNA dimethylallyltransferase
MLPAVLLMGPTASGKSVLALELATRFDGEIVSVDSAQVYRGMDIGTGKPDVATRARVAHHLIDILDPTDAYSAARFVADALRAIADIRGHGRLPIVAGGTMLYFKALTEGLSALPSADSAVRDAIDREASRVGWPAMHAKLGCVDPELAARLKPTDAQRIQRALEVFRVSGIPLSQLQGQRHANASALGPHVALALLPPDRAALHDAIAARFESMLSAGLVAELEGLRARYALRRELPSMRSVGYRQAWDYLEGAIDAQTLRARGIAATRQLAKRQFTWLKSMNAETFPTGAVDTLDQVLGRISKMLSADPVGG